VITNKQILSSKAQVLEEAKNLQVKVEELRKERDTVASLDSQNLKKLYEVLPQKQNLPEIMAQIDALIRKQDLVLGSIQIDNPQDSSADGETPAIDKRIKSIQVSIFILGGDGSYEKIKELLDALEKHIRLIDITSFSFDPEMTTYSIIFKTYYLD
jgi:Tfp pilus assembly protein PilO